LSVSTPARSTLPPAPPPPTPPTVPHHPPPVCLKKNHAARSRSPASSPLPTHSPPASLPPPLLRPSPPPCPPPRLPRRRPRARRSPSRAAARPRPPPPRTCPPAAAPVPPLLRHAAAPRPPPPRHRRWRGTGPAGAGTSPVSSISAAAADVMMTFCCGGWPVQGRGAEAAGLLRRARRHHRGLHLSQDITRPCSVSSQVQPDSSFLDSHKACLGRH
uniref:Uncharacterized protein n=2 Tax=Aegilops tauschii subsp. strangulata TaxID=200361 RepID=A0A453MYE7_AEGTS